MKKEIRKNIHNVSQGPPNPRFMPEKVQKGDFLKNARLFVLGSYESPKGLESSLFWPSKNLYKQLLGILILERLIDTANWKKIISPSIYLKLNVFI